MALLMSTGRFALAIMFVLAGASKLLDRRRFQAAVQDYQLVPTVLVPAVARAVALFETAAGALLLIGFVVRPVTTALAVLLLGFSTAAGINLVRGRRIDCGCWGGAGRKIGWPLVGRNVVLALLAALLASANPSARAFNLLHGSTAPGLAAGDALVPPLLAGLLLLGALLVSHVYRLASVRRRLDAVTSERSS
jgi:hypothetical protein